MGRLRGRRWSTSSGLRRQGGGDWCSRTPGGSREEVGDGRQRLGRPLGLRVVASTFDDAEPRDGDAGGKKGLALRREEEVVVPGDDRVGTWISPSRTITLQPRIICPPNVSASGRVLIRHPPPIISRASRRRLNRWSYAGSSRSEARTKSFGAIRPS